jgi:hypothetical protein
LYNALLCVWDPQLHHNSSTVAYCTVTHGTEQIEKYLILKEMKALKFFNL